MTYIKQNDLLLVKLMDYYKEDENLNKMLNIINGNSKISLRIVDWFATNFAKKYYTVFDLNEKRFKVYVDYKLNLKAYSKKRFDPFCRWDRITIPYKGDTVIQTTIGQLNFFKWVLEHKILDYIEKNFNEIKKDQDNRNSTAKNRKVKVKQTRKKREELSISASKSIKKEQVEIIVDFK